MRLVQNHGADRVIDLIAPHLQAGHQFGRFASGHLLFALGESTNAPHEQSHGFEESRINAMTLMLCLSTAKG